MSDDPDARARAFLASLPRDPDVAILTSVLNAALMVKHLPPYAGENTTLPRIVTIACREDFWTNVRLLIEFLYRFPSRHDPNATTVLTKWPKAKDPLATRLNEYWDIASKHVAHFGPERFYGGLEAVDVSVSGHRRIADDVLQEWTRFIEAVEADVDKSHLADLLKAESGT